ncbi:hypothetical protein TNCV_904011 [Trichonephila clavipes]|nr:hypothetical protein TNCV_904011 [Trichonephila clavipes]
MRRIRQTWLLPITTYLYHWDTHWLTSAFEPYGLRTIVTMSDMETEPPDITKKPHNSIYPEINDESMAEYERLKSIGTSMTMEEISRFLSLDMAFFKMHKVHQEVTKSNQRYNRQAAQSNDKRRKQKEPKKKATDPKETDNDRCRRHKEIQKDAK